MASERDLKQRKEERWKYREKLTTWIYQLMTCRYERTARWREGRGENFFCHLLNPSITFLIPPLPLSSILLVSHVHLNIYICVSPN